MEKVLFWEKRFFIIVILMLSSILFMLPIKTKASSNPYSGGYGNCTWTAWQLCYDSTGHALPAWGDAGTWLNSANSAGYTTSLTARENSVAVWYDSGRGHVGWVTGVSDGKIYVKEGGYSGAYHEGWLPASGYRNSTQYIAGYIYVGNLDNDSVPIGVYDAAVSQESGKVRVLGWAYDPDDTGKALEIHVYIDETYIGAGSANQNKPNFFKQDIGDNHGFDFTLDTKGITGRHKVRVFAIGIDSGGNNNDKNLPMGEFDVDIKADNIPTGIYDAALSEEGGKVRVVGWAYDVDNTGKALEIHVYIDETCIGKGSANQYKPNFFSADVGDYHAFDFTLDTNGITGLHKVRVFAIGINSAGVNNDKNLPMGEFVVDIKTVKEDSKGEAEDDNLSDNSSAGAVIDNHDTGMSETDMSERNTLVVSDNSDESVGDNSSHDKAGVSKAIQTVVAQTAVVQIITPIILLIMVQH